MVRALAFFQCYHGCRTGEVTRTPRGFSMDTLVFNFLKIRLGMVQKQLRYGCAPSTSLYILGDDEKVHWRNSAGSLE